MNYLFNTKLIGLCFITVILTFSCKERESEDRPKFPSAEFYSPWYVTSGDTVTIGGVNLEGSEVYVNSEKVELLDTEDGLTFLVPEGFTGGKVKVIYPSGEIMIFGDSLHYVSDENDPKRTELEGIVLISDFDGTGIRPTTAGFDFTTGAWLFEGPAGSNTGILRYQNVPSSPAGGYYFYNAVQNWSIGGVETSGWAGSLSSRNELMNDNETSFPVSFADYPNSPVDFEGNASDHYLNFYYKAAIVDTNRNGESPAEIRVFLVNPALNLEDQYAFTISNGDNIQPPSIDMPSDEEWHGISIPLNKFKNGYGFEDEFSNSDLKSFNAIQFNFADSRVNSDEPDEQKEADGPIEVFIDQVSISKGTPIYN